MLCYFQFTARKGKVCKSGPVENNAERKDKLMGFE
jgi:hypothetical protein